MKKVSLPLITLLAITSFFYSCNNESNEKKLEKVTETKEEMIKRGEYLTTVIGCDHCHTPKKMTPNGPVSDRDKWLMGYPSDKKLPSINKSEITPDKWVLFTGDLTATVGPWGVSFAANLTPAATGIGSWSFEQFKKAMTEGKFKGLDNSRPIMPPMPWESLRELKENDLKAIFTYLMSIKPIENIVPNYIPPTEL